MQRPDDSEGYDGERFVEPFLEGGGSAWVIRTQLPSQSSELIPGSAHRRRRPGATDGGTHPRLLPLGQVLQHVAHLVDLAALDQGPGPEDAADRLAHPLAAVDHEQPGAFDEQTALDEVLEQTLTHLLTLAAASSDSQYLLAPRRIDSLSGQHEVLVENDAVELQHREVDTAERPAEERFHLPRRAGHEPSRHAGAARAPLGQLDRQRLQAVGVAPRAHPEQDLPLRPLIQRVLLAEVAPVRQLQFASVDTAGTRLRDADLAAPEHELAHIVAVPVGPPVGLDLALGAAEQRAVLLESLPQLLQPGGEQEVAQGEPRVQDRPRKQLLARRGQGQRGKDGIRDRSFRAVLLHDGGSSFWLPTQ